MPLKAIMYHYVRAGMEGFPNFKYLHVEDFRRQLDYFEQAFGFVRLEDLLAAFDGAPLPRGVLLTFDDGVIDHFEVVFPELERRGIQGFFYVPVAPLQNGQLLAGHRVHLLLGRFSAHEVAERLRALVSEDMLEASRLEEFRRTTYRHQHNPEEALFVKRLLNYHLAPQYRQAVLDDLMQHFFGDEEAEIAASFYMRPRHLRTMHEAGMIIGSHSVSHPVMSRLPAHEQEREIEQSFAFLENLLGSLQPRTFCYPYGGSSTFTRETEQLLGRLGVRFSLAVEPRDVTLDDLRHRPQALPRYDCNMFPHGQCRN